MFCQYRRLCRCCAHIIFQKNWRAAVKVNIVNIQFKVSKVKIQFPDVSDCYSAGLGSLVPIEQAHLNQHKRFPAKTTRKSVITRGHYEQSW